MEQGICAGHVAGKHGEKIEHAACAKYSLDAELTGGWASLSSIRVAMDYVLKLSVAAQSGEADEPVFCWTVKAHRALFHGEDGLLRRKQSTSAGCCMVVSMLVVAVRVVMPAV